MLEVLENQKQPEDNNNNEQEESPNNGQKQIESQEEHTQLSQHTRDHLSSSNTLIEEENKKNIHRLGIRIFGL